MIRTALSLAKPCAKNSDMDVSNNGYDGTRAILPLLLRIGFSALFSNNHAEAPPKVVAFLTAPRNQLLFRIPAHYGLGPPFDITRFGGLRWSRKDRKYGTHRWRKRVRSAWDRDGHGRRGRLSSNRRRHAGSGMITGLRAYRADSRRKAMGNGRFGLGHV